MIGFNVILSILTLFLSKGLACNDTILGKIGKSSYTVTFLKDLAAQGEHTMIYFTKPSPSLDNRKCITSTLSAEKLQKTIKYVKTAGTPDTKCVDVHFEDRIGELSETWSPTEKYFVYIIYFKNNVLGLLGCPNSSSYPMWIQVSAATKAKGKTDNAVNEAANILKGWNLNIGIKRSYC